MVLTAIDVWNAATFDDELSSLLADHAALIRNYMTADRDIFLSYDLGRGPRRPLMRPDNPHATSFLALKETVSKEMSSRIIRAWHYTRLTGSELESMRRDGIHLSTPKTLRARLDALITSGKLDAQQADALFKYSPFHQQLDIRANRFWMVSHPIAVDDSGVVPLMSHWGGEVASMWVDDPLLLHPLTVIGKARVLEVYAPLSFSRHSYSAAEAVIATFSRSLGCIPDNRGFDLYVTVPLPPSALIQVHSSDDGTFPVLGRGYPADYADTSADDWRALTGTGENS